MVDVRYDYNGSQYQGIEEEGLKGVRGVVSLSWTTEEGTLDLGGGECPTLRGDGVDEPGTSGI